MTSQQHSEHLFTRPYLFEKYGHDWRHDSLTGRHTLIKLKLEIYCIAKGKPTPWQNALGTRMSCYNQLSIGQDELSAGSAIVNFSFTSIFEIICLY